MLGEQVIHTHTRFFKAIVFTANYEGLATYWQSSNIFFISGHGYVLSWILIISSTVIFYSQLFKSNGSSKDFHRQSRNTIPRKISARQIILFSLEAGRGRRRNMWATIVVLHSKDFTFLVIRQQMSGSATKCERRFTARLLSISDLLE